MYVSEDSAVWVPPLEKHSLLLTFDRDTQRIRSWMKIWKCMYINIYFQISFGTFPNSKSVYHFIWLIKAKHTTSSKAGTSSNIVCSFKKINTSAQKTEDGSYEMQRKVMYLRVFFNFGKSYDFISYCEAGRAFELVIFFLWKVSKQTFPCC